MKETWYPQGCRAPSFVIDTGDPVECCGCPLVRIADPGGAWRDCDCRCHEGAKAMDRLLPKVVR